MRVMGPPPRRTVIKGQPHMLSYITPDEADILKALGGSGEAGPMGIPSYPPDGYDGGGGTNDSSGSSSSGKSDNNDRDPGRSGPGDMGAQNNASNTDNASNNQQTGQGSSDPDANDPRASDWDNWAQTVGQNYADPVTGNVTTPTADGKGTVTTLGYNQIVSNLRNDPNDEAGKLAQNIQNMIEDGRIDPYSSDSTNIQNAIIGSGMVDGLSRDQRIQALEDLGRRVAMGEQLNANGKPSYDLSFLGGGNINGWANNNPDITNEEMAQAFADGFNSQTGTEGINTPWGSKLGKGLGGTRLDVLANGDITIQSGGSKVGENVLNLAKSFYAGVPGSFIDVNFGTTNYDGWNKFGKNVNAPQGNNFNVSLDPLGGLMSQVVSPYVGKNISSKVGKEVYDRTENLALGMSAAAAANAYANSQIKEGLKQAGISNTANIASIDLTGGQAGANPNVSTGKGSAVKGSATDTIQSDLSADDTLSNPATDGGSTAASNFAVGGDAPFSKGSDYTKAGITYGGYEDDLGPDGNAVDATAPNANGMGFGGSVTTTNTNNDDGGQNDNKWLQLQGQIKDIIDQGQNTGANYLSPISYLSPASGRGFGNYLTRGKNRDYGSATFREASKNEIDRGKRRGGFGQIMFA
jgi:hypothetical protein